jgi:hypothetical protein
VIGVSFILTNIPDMKRTFSILVLLLAVVTLSAQDITGKWSGKLVVPQGELRVNFNISSTENGYTSTLDSPDQNAFGIAVDTTIFAAPELTIKVSMLDLVWVGTLVDEGSMNGKLTQMGQTMELNMKKAEE